MALATLEQIEKKIRYLTRSPSSNEITSSEISDYINTALLFDFPASLKLFPLKTTFTFYTQPFVDTYETSTDPDSALFNFKNKYYSVHPPAYIAGIPAAYYQDRQTFFASWPFTNFRFKNQLFGNGTPGPYSGTLTRVPVMANNVVVSALNSTGQAMVLRDYPQDNIAGLLGVENTTNPINGIIDYETGQFTVTFPGNVPQGADITATVVPYLPSKPISVLYFNSKFIVRPIPDGVYPVQVEVFLRPTELIASSDTPLLEQWWEYIAYVAAKKILQDRMDVETVALIMPELKHQEKLVGRATLMELMNKRTQTIYTLGGRFNGPGFGWFGNYY